MPGRQGIGGDRLMSPQSLDAGGLHGCPNRRVRREPGRPRPVLDHPWRELSDVSDVHPFSLTRPTDIRPPRQLIETRRDQPADPRLTPVRSQVGADISLPRRPRGYGSRRATGKPRRVVWLAPSHKRSRVRRTARASRAHGPQTTTDHGGGACVSQPPTIAAPAYLAYGWRPNDRSLPHTRPQPRLRTICCDSAPRRHGAQTQEMVRSGIGIGAKSHARQTMHTRRNHASRVPTLSGGSRPLPHLVRLRRSRCMSA